MFGNILTWATELNASGFASGAQKVNSQLGEMGIRTGAATANMGVLGTVLGSMASPMTLVALGATAVGGAMVGAVQSAAAWQSSMAGVSKTTGLAGEDLKGLSKELLDMSTNMPVAASEIANVAQAAGSLGIVKDDIAGFTEVALQMGVGFEMAADQAAMSGAKILTAFSMDTTAANMEKLGNVMNAMGDNFAATEAQVLDFTNRASFLNTTFGLSIPQVAAWGTALISAGMDADTAATGIKSLMNMSMDPKKFEAFAKAAGMSSEELRENLNRDIVGTFMDVSAKISEGTDAVETFQTVAKLAGTEGMTAFLKMGSASDEAKKALELANSEWENGSSLAKTYAAQQETFNAQMQIFWNTLNLAGVELGTVFLPALTSGIQFLADMTLGIIKTGEAIYDVIGAWNEWVKLGVGKFAKLEQEYEAANPGRWELVGDDAVWISNAQEAALTYTDEWGRTFDISDYKSFLVDKSKEAAIEAGTEAGEDGAKAFADSQKAWIDANANYYAAGFGMAGRQYGENGQVLAEGSWTNWTEGKSSDPNDRIYDANIKLGEQEAIIRNIASAEGSIYELRSKSGELIAKTNLMDTGQLSQFNPVEWAKQYEEAKVTMLEFLDFKMEDARIPDAAQGFADQFSKGLEDVDWENLPGLLESKKKLEDSMIWMLPTEQATFASKTDAHLQKYKEALLAGIVDSGKFLKDEFARIGKESKSAFSDNFLSSDESSALLGLEPELRLLQSTFPEQFKALGGDSILAMITAIKAGDLPGAMATLGEEAAQGYKSGLFGALQSGGESRSLAEIISSGGKGIADVSAWMENEFGPKLNSEMESMNKLWDSGLTDNRKIVEEDLGLLKSTFEDHGDWFKDWQQDLIELYRAGDITTNQFLDKWGEYAKKADESAKNAAEVVKSANALFYNEIRDDTKTWHDYINSEGGFVGPTEDWYAMKIEQQGRINEIARLKAEFEGMGGQSPIGIGSINQELEMAVSMDTTAALSATEDLVSAIQSSEPDMVLHLDTNGAYTAWGHLVQDIEALQPVMRVQIAVDASQIRAAVRAEIADAVGA